MSFDINDRETIIKLINSRTEGEYIIPLYVKMYNTIYSILDIDTIKEFSPSGFKVGFGTIVTSSSLVKNPLPGKYTFEFNHVTSFVKFDEKTNMDIRYGVFESSFVDGDDLLYEQINFYVTLLGEYVSLWADKNKQTMKAMIQEMLEYTPNVN